MTTFDPITFYKIEFYINFYPLKNKKIKEEEDEEDSVFNIYKIK